MKCYYCQTESEIGPTGAYVKCQKCAEENDLRLVITFYDRGINGPASCAGFFTNDRFHMRSWPNKNYTEILVYEELKDGGLMDVEEIVTIPNLSLIPSNFKEKLKLYILFS